MNIIHFNLGDTLRLRKPHPCGSHEFTVMYVGSDIKIRCLGCGHDIIIPRTKLEKGIKEVISRQDNQ